MVASESAWTVSANLSVFNDIKFQEQIYAHHVIHIKNIPFLRDVTFARNYCSPVKETIAWKPVIRRKPFLKTAKEAITFEKPEPGKCAFPI